MAWTYKTAVVVDDAFGAPKAGSVPAQDKDAWFDFVHEDAAAAKQLLDAYVDLKMVDASKLIGHLLASNELIQDLWARKERGDLKAAGLDKLFATESLNRQATTEKASVVRDFLIQNLGRENVQIFANLESAGDALAQTDVAFIDFFLRGNDEKIDDALQRIRNHGGILRKPKLLFFMSSRANVETQQRVREELHIRSAFFEVMEKREISDDFVRSKLSRKAIDFDANRALERIVLSLAQAIKDAAADLETATETLETHDLKLLDLARLEAEGETLPQYLTWLFSEFVAARARRKSGNQSLVRLEPKQVGFTGHFLQARVLFDLFSEVVFGPGSAAGSPLRFGEVLQLTAKPDEYVVLLTPACDLARCDGGLEVLCVRGYSTLVDGAKAHATRRLYGKAGNNLAHLRVHPDPKTGKEQYSLITWVTKEAFTRSASELSGGAYARVQLMNELFAQEVKEEVLRSLGRIGTQINPPPAASLNATARWKASSDEHQAETPHDDFLAALVMYSERPTLGKSPVPGPLIVLSDAFRAWLRREIEASFANSQVDAKLQKCFEELDQEHFQAKGIAPAQFKGTNFVIQLRPANEKLDGQLDKLLEITLWTDAEDSKA